MSIAVIKDTVCIDAAVFDNIATAQEFLKANVWEADSVVELPDGYGIGDSYVGGEWVKAPQPEPIEQTEPEPDTDIAARIGTVEQVLSTLVRGLLDDE